MVARLNGVMTGGTNMGSDSRDKEGAARRTDMLMMRKINKNIVYCTTAGRGGTMQWKDRAMRRSDGVDGGRVAERGGRRAMSRPRKSRYFSRMRKTYFVFKFLALQNSCCRNHRPTSGTVSFVA